ncbi:MAG: GNAT family N-acetyltransferase [Prevotella sp.]|nr:GNAT family N-acetyltransferase [Prevotella sp.]
MNYNIRKIREDEHTLLNDFIYEAIFIPEGVEPPPKSIINQPDLQVYISNFGKEKDDLCFVAEADGKVVGAVWVRDMNDYGHIAEGVPSFAISLYKEYRNFGIGTRLMETMLCELKDRGYSRTSLAVQKANYAVKMYKKVGFEIYDENDEEYIMVCELKNI